MLRLVLRLTQNDEVDGAELHERFRQAAEAGGEFRLRRTASLRRATSSVQSAVALPRALTGEFVSYAWRNKLEHKVQLKGAYIQKTQQWGQSYYAGVGYSLVPPPPAERTGM